MPVASCAAVIMWSLGSVNLQKLGGRTYSRKRVILLFFPVLSIKHFLSAQKF